MNDITTLADLPRGSCALVSALCSHGSMRRRLQELGLVPGTKVECVQKSPLGDPAAYLFRGTVIALRREDSSRVLVRP